MAGAAGLWLGMPNALLQLPAAALLYPAALFFTGRAAARNGGTARAFRRGWLCGLAGASACLYWVALPVHDVGGLPWPLAAPCALILGAYVGLYGGLFAALVHMVCRPARDGSPPPGPCSRALILGLGWYLLEWMRGWFCTGFPWLSLAAAFAPWPVLIQGASLVGSYGLGGIMAGLVCLALGGDTLRPAALAAAGFALLLAFGIWRLPAPDRAAPPDAAGQDAAYRHASGTQPDARPVVRTETRTPRFALIQGNIDQNVKWDPAMQERTIRRYLELSADALAAEPRPDLLIWPETAMPFDYLRTQTAFAARIRAFAAANETAVLFGAPGFRRRLEPANRNEGSPGAEQDWEAFNRAFLISPAGRDLARYEKEHLVPFGEYLPPWLDLPFLRPLLQGVGTFSPGEKRLPLVLDRRASALAPTPARETAGEEAPPALVLGVLICYETIFPELARQRVADGATVFVNISNDAWFGRSAAARQHLQLGLLRAVEQRRWLARATNTGISAFIDPFGRVAVEGDLFTARSVTHAVRPLEERTPFFYLEPFLPGLAALLVIALLARHRFFSPLTHRFRKQPCNNLPT